MSRLPKLILTISTFIFYYSASSQIFGGDPPSLKWRQINTPAARIIFPKGYDSISSRIANIISFIKDPTEKTIGNHSKKINLVLQNQTTVSNAYVNLGPFRSEFFMTPDQNSFEMGSLPWSDQLAIHEYRHVEQYNNFDVGLSKVMRIIFGQEGQALANNAAIPNWFYEGDAVYNETNVSEQGRGHLPAFFNDYRSLWKAGKNYSWMKLRNGSLKDFVPDHYPLGYMLVSYGREKYGDYFWKNVTHDAAAYKNLFYPFQHALKKYSGLSFVSFRDKAIDFFKASTGTNESTNEHKNKANLGTFRDEQFPSFTEDGSLIFVKHTFKQIPAFVIRNPNGEEHKIRSLDYTMDDYFSYRNGKIIYTSFRPDIRWGYRDYSEVQIIDITNGHQQTLTSQSKYFSPDISQDGKTIVVVDEPASGYCYLKLLHAQNGKLIRIIPNPHHLFYTYPKFFDNKKIITAVRNREGKMSLQQIDLKNDQTEILLPFSFNVIGFPWVKNDTLYFSLSFKKNDELFAYSFSDKKLWQLIVPDEQGIGKYHPSIHQQKLVWTSFTAEGNRLQESSLSSVQFVQKDKKDINIALPDFGITVLNKTNADLLKEVPNDTFKIARYAKSFQLFNFHSIEPAINDPDYTLTLVGENILNTLQSNLSFTYDRAEKYKEVSFAAIYGGWFPYLSAGANYLIDRSSLFHQNLIHYNQFEPYTGFNIPLNFSRKRTFTYVNFGSQYVYSNAIFNGRYKDTLQSSYSYLSNFLTFTNQVQQAPQQIFPRFAQTLSLTYKTLLSEGKGFQYMSNASLYFPGIMQTHSLVINGAFFQKDSLNRINFSSSFPFSRGYQSVNFYQMIKWGVNYHLPLALPDWGFADIFYLLRVRANLFYDDTEAKDFYSNHSPFNASFRSTGTEINFDSKWWNSVNVSFGIRYSRLLDKDLYGAKGYNRWEIILPVNILNQ